MKAIFVCCCLLLGLFLSAQDNKSAVMAQARQLNEAVFVKKDSSFLSGIFLDQLTYGHSSGKVENRKDALHNIIHNTSVYENVQLSGEEAWVKNKTAVTRYLLTTTEKKLMAVLQLSGCISYWYGPKRRRTGNCYQGRQ